MAKKRGFKTTTGEVVELENDDEISELLSLDPGTKEIQSFVTGQGDTVDFDVDDTEGIAEYLALDNKAKALYTPKKKEESQAGSTNGTGASSTSSRIKATDLTVASINQFNKLNKWDDPNFTDLYFNNLSKKGISPEVVQETRNQLEQYRATRRDKYAKDLQSAKQDSLKPAKTAESTAPAIVQAAEQQAKLSEQSVKKEEAIKRGFYDQAVNSAISTVQLPPAYYEKVGSTKEQILSNTIQLLNKLEPKLAPQANAKFQADIKAGKQVAEAYFNAYGELARLHDKELSQANMKLQNQLDKLSDISTANVFNPSSILSVSRSAYLNYNRENVARKEYEEYVRQYPTLKKLMPNSTRFFSYEEFLANTEDPSLQRYNQGLRDFDYNVSKWNYVGTDKKNLDDTYIAQQRQLKFDSESLAFMHEQASKILMDGKSTPEMRAQAQMVKNSSQLAMAEISRNYPAVVQRQAEQKAFQLQTDLKAPLANAIYPGGIIGLSIANNVGRAITDYIGNAVTAVADQPLMPDMATRFSDAVSEAQFRINEGYFGIPSNMQAPLIDRYSMINYQGKEYRYYTKGDQVIDVRTKNGYPVYQWPFMMKSAQDVYDENKSTAVKVSDFRGDLMLPKLARTGTDMFMLLYGANKLGALMKTQKGGLVLSGYFSEYENAYREVMANNPFLSDADARMYAGLRAGVVSSLELINPQSYVFKEAGIRKLTGDYVKIIAQGADRWTAAKMAMREMNKEGLGEVLQEYSQDLAGKGIDYLTNIALGDQVVDVDFNVDEWIETGILTYATAGILKGVTDMPSASDVEASAFYSAAENYDKANIELQTRWDEFTPEQQQRASQVLNDLKLAYDQVPKDVDDATKVKLFKLIAGKNSLLKNMETATTPEAQAALQEHLASIDNLIDYTYKIKVPRYVVDGKQVSKVQIENLLRDYDNTYELMASGKLDVSIFNDSYMESRFRDIYDELSKRQKQNLNSIIGAGQNQKQLGPSTGKTSAIQDKQLPAPKGEKPTVPGSTGTTQQLADKKSTIEQELDLLNKQLVDLKSQDSYDMDIEEALQGDIQSKLEELKKVEEDFVASSKVEEGMADGLQEDGVTWNMEGVPLRWITNNFDETGALMSADFLNENGEHIKITDTDILYDIAISMSNFWLGKTAERLYGKQTPQTMQARTEAAKKLVPDPADALAEKDAAQQIEEDKKAKAEKVQQQGFEKDVVEATQAAGMAMGEEGDAATKGSPGNPAGTKMPVYSIQPLYTGLLSELPGNLSEAFDSEGPVVSGRVVGMVTAAAKHLGIKVPSPGEKGRYTSSTIKEVLDSLASQGIFTGADLYEAVRSLPGKIVGYVETDLEQSYGSGKLLYDTKQVQSQVQQYREYLDKLVEQTRGNVWDDGMRDIMALVEAPNDVIDMALARMDAERPFITEQEATDAFNAVDKLITKVEKIKTTATADKNATLEYLYSFLNEITLLSPVKPEPTTLDTYDKGVEGQFNRNDNEEQIDDEGDQPGGSNQGANGGTAGSGGAGDASKRSPEFERVRTAVGNLEAEQQQLLRNFFPEQREEEVINAIASNLQEPTEKIVKAAVAPLGKMMQVVAAKKLPPVIEAIKAEVDKLPPDDNSGEKRGLPELPDDVVVEKVEGGQRNPINSTDPRGGFKSIKFAKNVTVQGQYRVIEASELQPSHYGSGERNPQHGISEAQPKERGDVASKEAQNNIAYNLNWDEHIGGADAYSGPPVVNQRGEVIQGNNRSLGLKLLWMVNPSSTYKDELISRAESLGFNPSEIQRMQQPVLVREVKVTDSEAVNLGAYTFKDIETGGIDRLSPINTIRKLSPAERGMLSRMVFEGDYPRIKDAISENIGRILPVLKKYLSASEVNGLVNANTGKITADGMNDLVDLFQQIMFDGGPANLGTIFNRIPFAIQKNFENALPEIMDVDDSKSLLPILHTTINIIDQFENSGIETFDDWKEQTDMFLGASPVEFYSALEMNIAERLLQARNQKTLAPLMKTYRALVNDKPADMFDPPVPGESVEEAVSKVFEVEVSKKDLDKIKDFAQRRSNDDGLKVESPSRGYRPAAAIERGKMEAGAFQSQIGVIPSAWDKLYSYEPGQPYPETTLAYQAKAIGFNEVTGLIPMQGANKNALIELQAKFPAVTLEKVMADGVESYGFYTADGLFFHPFKLNIYGGAGPVTYQDRSHLEQHDNFGLHKGVLSVKTEQENIMYRVMSTMLGRPVTEGEFIAQTVTPKKTNNWNFIGAKEKAASAGDVANIFRSLENQTNEHFFVLLENAQGKQIIVHAGSGNAVQATVDVKAIFNFAKQFGAVKMWHVHNHPNGVLGASEPDKHADATLRKLASDTGMQVMDGIIIDLNTGEYAFFNTGKQAAGVSKYPEGDLNEPMETFMASPRTFSSANTTPKRIVNANDAAAAVMGVHAGGGPKFGFVMINDNREVVGVVYAQSMADPSVKAAIAANTAAKHIVPVTNYLPLGNQSDLAAINAYYKGLADVRNVVFVNGNGVTMATLRNGSGFPSEVNVGSGEERTPNGLIKNAIAAGYRSFEDAVFFAYTELGSADAVREMFPELGVAYIENYFDLPESEQLALTNPEEVESFDLEQLLDQFNRNDKHDQPEEEVAEIIAPEKPLTLRQQYADFADWFEFRHPEYAWQYELYLGDEGPEIRYGGKRVYTYNRWAASTQAIQWFKEDRKKVLTRPPMVLIDSEYIYTPNEIIKEGQYNIATDQQFAVNLILQRFLGSKGNERSKSLPVVWGTNWIPTIAYEAFYEMDNWNFGPEGSNWMDKLRDNYIPGKVSYYELRSYFESAQGSIYHDFEYENGKSATPQSEKELWNQIIDRMLVNADQRIDELKKVDKKDSRFISSGTSIAKLKQLKLMAEELRSEYAKGDIKYDPSFAAGLYQKKGFVLADGPGVGKTRIELVAAYEMAKRTGKPALFLTLNKSIVENTLPRELKALGIPEKEVSFQKENKNDPETKIIVGHYGDLASGKIGSFKPNEVNGITESPYSVVIFDESHAMKNLHSSARAMKGMQLVLDGTDYAVYATATPNDKVTTVLYWMAPLMDSKPGVPIETKIRRVGWEVGLNVNFHISKSGGGMSLDVKPMKGYTWPMVKQNIVALRRQLMRQGAFIRREFPFFGTFEETEFSPASIEGLPEFYKGQEDIKDKVKNGRNRIQQWQLFTQVYKLDAVVNQIKFSLNQGRQVVVIVPFYNNTTAPGAYDNQPEPHPSIVSLIYDKLKSDLGIEPDAVAKIYGAGSVTEEVNKFQSGEKQIAIMTAEKGGTGIDLDDQVGNARRDFLMVSPPYGGDSLDQLIHRGSRRNTKSPMRALIMNISDSYGDQMKKKVLDQKRKVVRMIQAGQDPTMIEAANWDQELEFGSGDSEIEIDTDGSPDDINVASPLFNKDDKISNLNIGAVSDNISAIRRYLFGKPGTINFGQEMLDAARRAGVPSINISHLNRKKYLGVYNNVTQSIRLQTSLNAFTAIHEGMHWATISIKDGNGESILDRVIRDATQADWTDMRKIVEDYYGDPKKALSDIRTTAAEALAVVMERSLNTPEIFDFGFTHKVLTPGAEFNNDAIQKLQNEFLAVLGRYQSYDPAGKLQTNIMFERRDQYSPGADGPLRPFSWSWVHKYIISPYIDEAAFAEKIDTHYNENVLKDPSVTADNSIYNAYFLWRQRYNQSAAVIGGHENTLLTKATGAQAVVLAAGNSFKPIPYTVKQYMDELDKISSDAASGKAGVAYDLIRKHGRPVHYEFSTYLVARRLYHTYRDIDNLINSYQTTIQLLDNIIQQLGPIISAGATPPKGLLSQYKATRQKAFQAIQRAIELNNIIANEGGSIRQFSSDFISALNSSMSARKIDSMLSRDEHLSGTTMLSETYNPDEGATPRTEAYVSEINNQYENLFETPTKMYDNINRQMVMMAYTTGLLTGEKAREYMSRKGYASFSRWVEQEFYEDPAALIHSSSVGRKVVGSFLEYKGSAKTIIDPVISQMFFIQEMFKKGYENKIWNHMANLAEARPGGYLSMYFRQIPGQVVSEVNPATGRKEFKVIFPNQPQQKNWIEFKRAGKLVRYEITDPAIMVFYNNIMHNQWQAAEGMMHYVYDFLHKGAQWFQYSTTAIYPLWPILNYTVDLVTRLMMSKAKARGSVANRAVNAPVIGDVKNIAGLGFEVLKNNSIHYNQMLAMGYSPMQSAADRLIDNLTMGIVNATGESLNMRISVWNHMKKVLGRDPNLEDFTMLSQYLSVAGADQTFLNSLNEADPLEIIEKAIGVSRDQGKIKQIKYAITQEIAPAIAELLKLPTDVTEITGRLNEYAKAKEMGKSDLVAMRMAQEVSTNFMRRGSSNKWNKFVSLIAYKRALTNATYQFYKNLNTKKGKNRTAATIAGLTTATILYWLYVYGLMDDEDKEFLKNMDPRALSQNVPILKKSLPGYKETDKGFVMLRIPDQVGAFTGAAALATIAFMDNTKVDPKTYAEVMLKIVPDDYNPISLAMTESPYGTGTGGAVRSIFGWTPTVLSTVAQTALNTRTYPYVGPITPSYMENLPYPMRYDAMTPPAAIDLSKQLDQEYGIKLSPKQIEFASRGLLGRGVYNMMELANTGDWEKFNVINLSRRELLFRGKVFNDFYNRSEENTQNYNALTSPKNEDIIPATISDEALKRFQSNMFQTVARHMIDDQAKELLNLSHSVNQQLGILNSDTEFPVEISTQIYDLLYRINELHLEGNFNQDRSAIQGIFNSINVTKRALSDWIMKPENSTLANKIKNVHDRIKILTESDVINTMNVMLRTMEKDLQIFRNVKTRLTI